MLNTPLVIFTLNCSTMLTGLVKHNHQTSPMPLCMPSTICVDVQSQPVVISGSTLIHLIQTTFLSTSNFPKTIKLTLDLMINSFQTCPIIIATTLLIKPLSISTEFLLRNPLLSLLMNINTAFKPINLAPSSLQCIKNPGNAPPMSVPLLFFRYGSKNRLNSRLKIPIRTTILIRNFAVCYDRHRTITSPKINPIRSTELYVFPPINLLNQTKVFTPQQTLKFLFRLPFSKIPSTTNFPQATSLHRHRTDFTEVTYEFPRLHLNPDPTSSQRFLISTFQVRPRFPTSILSDQINVNNENVPPSPSQRNPLLYVNARIRPELNNLPITRSYSTSSTVPNSPSTIHQSSFSYQLPHETPTFSCSFNRYPTLPPSQPDAQFHDAIQVPQYQDVSFPPFVPRHERRQRTRHSLSSHSSTESFDAMIRNNVQYESVRTPYSPDSRPNRFPTDSSSDSSEIELSALTGVSIDRSMSTYRRSANSQPTRRPRSPPTVRNVPPDTTRRDLLMNLHWTLTITPPICQAMSQAPVPRCPQTDPTAMRLYQMRYYLNALTPPLLRSHSERVACIIRNARQQIEEHVLRLVPPLPSLPTPPTFRSRSLSRNSSRHSSPPTNHRISLPLRQPLNSRPNSQFCAMLVLSPTSSCIAPQITPLHYQRLTCPYPFCLMGNELPSEYGIEFSELLSPFTAPTCQFCRDSTHFESQCPRHHHSVTLEELASYKGSHRTCRLCHLNGHGAFDCQWKNFGNSLVLSQLKRMNGQPPTYPLLSRPYTNDEINEFHNLYPHQSFWITQNNTLVFKRAPAQATLVDAEIASLAGCKVPLSIVNDLRTQSRSFTNEQWYQQHLIYGCWKLTCPYVALNYHPLTDEIDLTPEKLVCTATLAASCFNGQMPQEVRKWIYSYSIRSPRELSLIPVTVPADSLVKSLERLTISPPLDLPNWIPSLDCLLEFANLFNQKRKILADLQFLPTFAGCNVIQREYYLDGQLLSGYKFHDLQAMIARTKQLYRQTPHQAQICMVQTHQTLQSVDSVPPMNTRCCRPCQSPSLNAFPCSTCPKPVTQRILPPTPHVIKCLTAPEHAFHYESHSSSHNQPRKEYFLPLEKRAVSNDYWLNADNIEVPLRLPFRPTQNDLDLIADHNCKIPLEWLIRQRHLASHDPMSARTNEEWYTLHCIRGCTYFNCGYLYYNYHPSVHNPVEYSLVTRWDKIMFC